MPCECGCHTVYLGRFFLAVMRTLSLDITVLEKANILTVESEKISGHTQFTRSCGVDGFKNCRKGTNIAAQTTATVLSQVSSQ